MSRRNVIKVKPQPGPQERFLSSPADIAIYGGSAGGGKTWALLLEPLRHVKNPGFGAVIFRRTTPQIRNEGGLWDESTKLYSAFASPKSHSLEWQFPSGAKLRFAHLEHDDDRLSWQGSQIPLICFDEMTHFSEKQFWYLLSRNRSMCGVRPYVRGTCNPDPDSFVAKLIAWWIDQDTGYALPERSGVIRYFVRVNDDLHFAATPEELTARFPESGVPKSLTFIGAKLTDNQALMRADPGYLANLRALPTVERERLEAGNWKIRDERTVIFKPSWWRMWPDDKPLPQVVHVFAVWDTAFTAAEQRLNGKKPPDQSDIAYSACLVLGVWRDDKDVDPQTKAARHKLMLLSAWWGRVEWPELLEQVTKIGREKLTHPSDAHLIERAASGRSVIQAIRRNPRNRVIGVTPTAGDGRTDAKVLRAYLSQPYLKDGYVWAPNKPWARDVISHLGGFPGGKPPSADLADCMSMGIQHLARGWWIHHPDDEIDPVAAMVDEGGDDRLSTTRIYG